jgi:hypothetical protein
LRRSDWQPRRGSGWWPRRGINRQRQLLKDDKAGKLDSLMDILSAKKKKGAEEEEVDSKRTKKKMDVDASPSNTSPTNPGPVAPPTIEAPSTPVIGELLGGVVLDYSDLGFSFSCSNRWSVDGKINGMFSFKWKRSIPYFPAL